MPSYADFQRDYWAPDRDAVLRQMQPGVTPLPTFQPGQALPPTGGTGLPPMSEPGGLTGKPLGPVVDPEAQAPSSADPRSVLSGIYQQQGLDPNNPTGLANPLANVDYFLRRMGETGGWQGGNIDYWKTRLGQEIGLARQGLGNRQEGGEGPSVPWLGPHGAGPVPMAGGGSVAPGLPAISGGDDTGGLQSQVRAQVLRLMQQGEQPVDEQALGIRQPYQAAQLAAARQQDQERTALAERLYAQGGLGGNELTQGIQQSAERNAIGLAGLKSGLIQQEIGQRRQQLQQALALANSIGARQEAQQLARELAQIENQFRYAQLGQQGSQFQQELAQRGSQFGQNLGFQYAGLGQQQGMWNDRYGLERQRMVDEANRNAMLYGLMG